MEKNMEHKMDTAIVFRDCLEFRDDTPIRENQMQHRMANNMETNVSYVMHARGTDSVTAIHDAVPVMTSSAGSHSFTICRL